MVNSFYYSLALLIVKNISLTCYCFRFDKPPRNFWILMWFDFRTLINYCKWQSMTSTYSVYTHIQDNTCFSHTHCSPGCHSGSLQVFNTSIWNEVMSGLFQLNCPSHWCFWLQWDSTDPTGHNSQGINFIYTNAINDSAHWSNLLIPFFITDQFWLSWL